MHVKLTNEIAALIGLNSNLPSHLSDGKSVYYLDGNNSALCVKCANIALHEAEEEIRESGEVEDENTIPVRTATNHDDRKFYCEACGERIKPSYEDDTIDTSDEDFSRY